MELSDGDGRFILYDFYANLLPSKSGKITVPLNGLGYFRRSDGSPGSFGALIKAIASAKITGIEPVEIVANDMTAPIAAKPRLKLKITNALNRPMEGMLSVRIEGLIAEPTKQTVLLQGHETAEISVMIAGSAEATDNNYRLLEQFDAGQDRTKSHAELMHVNFVAKRRITVDGDLDDWQGVIPQTDIQEVSVSQTEKAYLPFLDWE